MTLIHLPLLDDQNYKKIFENAKKYIPKIYPDWTDENFHDPGITMLQLFSWLKEMQQYYIDQASDETVRKMLKLLGVAPEPIRCAKAKLAVTEVSGDVVLPRGTQFGAEDVVFETEDNSHLIDNRVAAILAVKRGKVRDLTGINENVEHTGAVFGRKPALGAELMIGFERSLPVRAETSLYFEIYNHYPVRRNEITDEREFIPLAELKWEYFAQEGQWRELHIIRDESICFLRSGLFTVWLDTPMAACPFSDFREAEADAEAAPGQYCWIRATLGENSYDVAPKLHSVTVNLLKVTQKETFCCKRDFVFCRGEELVCRLSDRLALHGDTTVFLKRASGDFVALDASWDYETRHLQAQSALEIEIRDHCLEKAGEADPGSEITIRVFSVDRRYKDTVWVGRTNGLPRQSIDCALKNLVCEDFSLMVGSEDEQGLPRFQEWFLTDDFTSSKAWDKHFILDASEGIVTFGDNEFGMSPVAADHKNILLISCSSSRGAGGNVKSGGISKLLSGEGEPEETQITCSNPWHAQGGAAAEKLEDAVLRFRRELKNPERAVTLADFELLAGNTPGLMVKRVKAVPMFRSAGRRTAQNTANCVGVIVEPYSESSEGVLSRGYIKNIEAHLEKYRLLTTQIEVMPPQYVGVDIYADIAVKPYFRNAKESLRRLVNDYFSGDQETGGRKFGQNVRFAEVYGLIEMNDSVSYIKDLTIESFGPDVSKNTNGDIEVPPNSIVYVKNFFLEVS